MPRTVKERTEEEWKKIESKLPKIGKEYPLFREEYSSTTSDPILTIKCINHNNVYRQRYWGIVRGKEGCSICQDLSRYNKFIDKLKKVYPDYRYTISFEDYINREHYKNNHFRVRAFCNIHKKYFIASEDSLLNGYLICNECKREKSEFGKSLNKEVPGWRNILTKDTIIKSLVSGETLRSLSKKYGILFGTFRNWVESLDIHIQKEIRRERRRLLSLQIKDLVELGYIKKDICSYLNISINYLNKISKEFNINLITGNYLNSSGENIILDYLNNSKISFKRGFYNKEILGRRKEGVFIDFYLDNSGSNIYIEFNGQQHFQYENFFHKGDYSNFQLQVKRDESVRKYCKEKGIILIEIPIFDYNTPESIENLLNKILKEGANPEDLIDIESYYEKPISEILNTDINP